MNNQLHIGGRRGSLRKDSYYKALLRAGITLVPEIAQLSIFESLQEIPPFNQYHETSPPEIVEEFKQQVISSDAIVFAIPEYNYSFRGVLKNTSNWVC